MAVTTRAYKNFFIELNPNLIIPDKAKNYDVAPEAIQNWAATKAPLCQDALATVEKNIRRVSFSEFSNGLKACVAQLPKNLLKDCVVLVANRKSNKWVAEVAKNYFPDKFSEKTIFLELGHEEANEFVKTLDEIPKKVWPTNIVLFDDASFSGNQMTSHVNKIVEKLTPQGSSTNLYVVVPIVTQVALDRLEKIRAQLTEKGSKIKLTIAHATKIATVKEILSEAELKAVNDYWGGALGKEGEDSGIALTYFDHKVPNSQSFLFATIGREVMPNITPPYI